MRRAAAFLAGFLLLAPLADSLAARAAAAPSWYRHPPAQRGYAVARASAESELAAVTDALVALALEHSGKRGQASEGSVAFGAIGVRTTRTIVSGRRAARIERVRATIEMKTARGAATIQWSRETPLARRRTQPVKRVFSADMEKTSARDLVAELRRAGVTVRTGAVGKRHYVLLRARISAAQQQPRPST